MRNIMERSFTSVLLAFLAAVLLATVWGAIVQTQFNLAALASIGVQIPAGVRLQTTLQDIFGGFTPTYAGFVVLPSLLVAFAVAWLVAARAPGATVLWFMLAGTAAILIGIPLVNRLSAVALLIGATREWLCTVLMALGGTLAGLLFVVFPGGVREVSAPRAMRTHHYASPAARRGNAA